MKNRSTQKWSSAIAVLIMTLAGATAAVRRHLSSESKLKRPEISSSSALRKEAGDRTSAPATELRPTQPAVKADAPIVGINVPRNVVAGGGGSSSGGNLGIKGTTGQPAAGA